MGKPIFVIKNPVSDLWGLGLIVPSVARGKEHLHDRFRTGIFLNVYPHPKEENMSTGIIILALPAAFLCLYLVRYIRYEIRVSRYWRHAGYAYSPGWFRIWVRLARGISGATGKRPPTH